MVQATRGVCGVVVLGGVVCELALASVVGGAVVCLMAALAVCAGLVVLAVLLCLVPVAAECWVIYRAWQGVVGLMGYVPVRRAVVAAPVSREAVLTAVATESVAWTPEMCMAAIAADTAEPVPTVLDVVPVVKAPRARKPRVKAPVVRAAAQVTGPVDYGTWTVVRLRAECKARGVRAVGRKAELVSRLAGG